MNPALPGGAKRSWKRKKNKQIRHAHDPGPTMKTNSVITPGDLLATHELAAKQILELRRKGVPCHLEDHSDSNGHRVDVVREAPGGGAEDQGELSDQ